MSKTLPLGDMPLATFLSEYWQKKPLVIRNAIEGFEPLMEADELAGLACEEEVESRLIVQDNGSQQWSMQHGPMKEEDFSSLPESHWTLLVQAVDHWHPDASQFLKLFDFIPQWRIDDLMISYASQGGGVGPHYDNYDVFLVQATGQREWQFGGLFDEHSPRADNDQLMLLDQWQAENTVTLNPGDILYLPPKVGHNGVALTDDCTTYSVGFRAPSHADILLNLSDFVAQDLSTELRYQDKDIQPQQHSALMDTKSISDIKDIMHSYIDKPGVIEQWFGCYMTEHKYHEQQQELYLENSVDEIIEAIEQSSHLSKIPGTRVAFQQSADEMLFFINGMCCKIALEHRDFVISLTENDQVSAQDVIESDERLKLMANLIKIGTYEII